MDSGNFPANGIDKIIEGAGIGFEAAEPHARIGTTFYTNAPGGFPSDYIASHDGPEFIWFDMGSDVALSEISYWGYSDTNANGLRQFRLSFATGAEAGTATLGDELYSSSISLTPEFSAVQSMIPRQSFTFDEVTARFVRLEAISTFFEQPGAGAGGDRLGIGEIAFAQPIPEASTGLLALISVGFLLRRRR